MALIGDFWPDPIGDDGYDWFNFCGEAFRVNVQTVLPMTRFMWTTKALEAAGDRARRDLAMAVTSGDVDMQAAAKAKLSRQETDEMAAMHQMLRDIIGPDQWDRFEELAITHSADMNLLMRIVVAVVEASSNRPTQRPGDSSTGPSSNGTGWAVPPTSPVVPGPTTGADAVVSERDRAVAEIKALMVPVGVIP